MVSVLSRTKKSNGEHKGFFGGFDISYYLEGIEKFKDCWTRCIEIKREYVDK